MSRRKHRVLSEVTLIMGENKVQRYLVAHDTKTLGFADTLEEAKVIISRHWQHWHRPEYFVRDLQLHMHVSGIKEFIAELDKERKNQAYKLKAQRRNKKPKAKRNDVIDNKYSKWLATQPCVVTGKIASRGAGQDDMHCHHIHGRARGRNDYMQVPLIGYAHTWGSQAYHYLGKTEFSIVWGIETDDIVKHFELLAVKLKIKYDKEQISA